MWIWLALQCHGTAIDFEPSIEEARRKAEKDGRLVLVLHVSGEFDKPALT